MKELFGLLLSAVFMVVSVWFIAMQKFDIAALAIGWAAMWNIIAHREWHKEKGETG